MSTLPACQEPRATGLEVLAVAATGQGLPHSTMTILSLPQPSQGHPHDTGPQEGLCLTRVLACLGQDRPTARRKLRSLGPVAGAGHAGAAVGPALVSTPPQAPGLPASGTGWVRRG